MPSNPLIMSFLSSSSLGLNSVSSSKLPADGLKTDVSSIFQGTFQQVLQGAAKSPLIFNSDASLEEGGALPELSFLGLPDSSLLNAGSMLGQSVPVSTLDYTALSDVLDDGLVDLDSIVLETSALTITEESENTSVGLEFMDATENLDTLMNESFSLVPSGVSAQIKNLGKTEKLEGLEPENPLEFVEVTPVLVAGEVDNMASTEFGVTEKSIELDEANFSIEADSGSAVDRAGVLTASALSAAVPSATNAAVQPDASVQWQSQKTTAPNPTKPAFKNVSLQLSAADTLHVNNKDTSSETGLTSNKLAFEATHISEANTNTSKTGLLNATQLQQRFMQQLVEQPLVADVVDESPELGNLKDLPAALEKKESFDSQLPQLNPPSLNAARVINGRAHIPMEFNFTHQQWSSAVAEKAAMLVHQKITSADIFLDPPELGPLQVKVQVHQDQAVVQFVSANAQVRDALDLSLVKLKDMLHDQGIVLVDSGVSDHSAGGGKNGGEETNPHSPSGQPLLSNDEAHERPVPQTTLQPWGIDYFV